jgi:dCMP deaminase
VLKNLNWDKRFLDLAEHISKWSKDPSTQVGAVAVRDRRILATGYNGFPRGILDSQIHLENREEKLLRTVHAETNIVAQASRHGVSLENAWIYIWPFVPCATCCTILMQAGVERIVVPDRPIPDRWKVSFSTSIDLLKQAGITLSLLAEN